MTAGVTDIVNPPTDGALAQTAAEKAAAAAAAQAAASAISAPTREGALAEIKKLTKNPTFREGLLKGGAQQTKTWRDLHAVAAAPDAAAEDKAELTKRYAALQAMGLPGPDTPAGRDLLDVMGGGKPISVQLRREIEARRTALMRDPGWTKRYLDGDIEARRQMTTIAVLMSAAVERAS